MTKGVTMLTEEQRAIIKALGTRRDNSFINPAEISLAERNDINVSFIENVQDVAFTYMGINLWKIGKTHWRCGKKGDGVTSDGVRYTLSGAIEQVLKVA